MEHAIKWRETKDDQMDRLGWTDDSWKTRKERGGFFGERYWVEEPRAAEASQQDLKEQAQEAQARENGKEDGVT